MIPKQLSAIDWSDITALVETKRAEDDTIEFKRAFKGGPDFLSLSDGKQKTAIESVAKEALAFLNANGGDIIIGMNESSNDEGTAEEICPIPNCSKVSDRLAQSLAARIEPFQTSLNVKAITDPSSGLDGVIVIRCNSSLRAPHRSKETRECYVRRGRESLPMPMDEIQDLTLNRTSRRSERLELLERQFVSFVEHKSGMRTFPLHRFHIRMVFCPFVGMEVDLSTKTLAKMFGQDPIYTNGKVEKRNDVTFRNLSSQWRPALRSRVCEGFSEYDGHFEFCQKSITNDLIMSTEFADSGRPLNNRTSTPALAFEWLVGFFANSISSMKSVLDNHPDHISGILKTAIFVDDGFALAFDPNGFGSFPKLMPGFTTVPIFEVNQINDFDEIFSQLCEDICALANFAVGPKISFKPDQ